MGEKRLQILFQSLLLLTALVGLLGLLGWLLAGFFGVIWALAIGVIPLIVAVRVFPYLTLKMYGARLLAFEEAPQLYRIVGWLAEEAGLALPPRPHYIPSSAPLVFSVGSGESAAIAVSDGLLRLLTLRELVGVLAHETSHIVNRDTWVMSFADVASRITRILSILGQLLLLVNLPLLILGNRPLPWLPLLLMAFAPSLSALLQLALSRTREYEADLEGARLTGDPLGLASALEKLEQAQAGRSRRLLRQAAPDPEPSLLRTHPLTARRIDRLLAYEQEMRPLKGELWATADERFSFPPHLPRVTRKPRRPLFGSWH